MEVHELYLSEGKGGWSIRFRKAQVMRKVVRNIIKYNINVEFIDKNLSEAKFNKMGQVEYKQFIYYFEKSLSKLDELPKDVRDFTFDTFKKQYRFYKNLIKKIKVKEHWNNTLSVLKEFYIFLIKYINDNDILHNIFLGTSITIDELINHNFNSYQKLRVQNT